ncbi:hypothetical protein COV56_01745 [Candidatus Kuenenbacteria bacterium CG11_big_fil_rev_8_21_14_0_20_37_9]|uniref:UDP-N-acetylmuramoyl-tripeptide--D-alanyl-D-alanine ligase n=2 Tax=Candidatus Kueneniibacteriota TaxID=1752740 RepID=A0A2M6XTA3_9BACT|nr:MAG: hypothetical protein AUJ29_01400 [Candidatus Kuenenbacteria bacterium CG1_02_38_13]PIR05645.1 MAG: hypothetical protein COV56_01745 [Candidatus Kuenenbacteria bacterium CG11_big_fil_rev_8_21_14_0_20_37_9]PIU10883.1 MAG: hypothetical protein COT27_00815 [Candidatus Kuenenbacteria bacterium CG08_land_8_20_14_0_20_37_23]
MKKIIQSILKILAQTILKKYKPDVIGVTGSVGKTTTKLAIKMILDGDFNVRASEGNYNTEIGVPLSIIGIQSAGKSAFGWFVILIKALGLIIKKNREYPDILVLEMAADHPGDIKYLVEFCHPKIGIITAVGPTHLEFFDDVQGVLREKANMVNFLESDQAAILDFDDKEVMSLENKTKARVITYGLKEGAQIRASNILVDKVNGGICFQLEYDGAHVPVSSPDVLGKPQVYAALAGSALGIYYGMNLIKIAERIKKIKALPGRLRLLPGIKGTRIIDDSYNSSPIALNAALEILLHMNCTGEKWAVLGDMLELGNYTEQAHMEMGETVARTGIDYMVCVGERSHGALSAAKNYGMNPDRMFHFDNAAESAKFVQDRIQTGDLILVKGSRDMHCENIVREIMAEPWKADELLV